MELFKQKKLVKTNIVYDLTTRVVTGFYNEAVNIHTTIIREEYNVKYFWQKNYHKEVYYELKQFVPYTESNRYNASDHNDALNVVAEEEEFKAEVWLKNNKFSLEEKYGNWNNDKREERV